MLLRRLWDDKNANETCDECVLHDSNLKYGAHMRKYKNIHYEILDMQFHRKKMTLSGNLSEDLREKYKIYLNLFKVSYLRHTLQAQTKFVLNLYYLCLRTG